MFLVLDDALPTATVGVPLTKGNCLKIRLLGTAFVADVIRPIDLEALESTLSSIARSESLDVEKTARFVRQVFPTFREHLQGGASVVLSIDDDTRECLEAMSLDAVASRMLRADHSTAAISVLGALVLLSYRINNNDLLPEYAARCTRAICHYCKLWNAASLENAIQCIAESLQIEGGADSRILLRHCKIILLLLSAAHTLEIAERESLDWRPPRYITVAPELFPYSDWLSRKMYDDTRAHIERLAALLLNQVQLDDANWVNDPPPIG